ncbi:hypothetical protein GCK72_011942 [Caenorhabditis remanei]|uniref:Uncharacterized protein n=1 Tax=Caenorhabditis remanei TaxID=31234 RepID=A0A6A5GLW8_CAERE|nr:hypothetical protein GCK72_011942 [Caenorhabditis remanei]KAF1755492.1 hypothetical protein GCK72_011942 [Caenorhabditis remanei]
MSSEILTTSTSVKCSVCPPASTCGQNSNGNLFCVQRVPIENYMPLMSTGALVCFGVAALIIFILGCLVVYGIRHPDSWPGRAVETAWLWARFVCCLFLCFDIDEADDEAQPVNRVV